MKSLRNIDKDNESVTKQSSLVWGQGLVQFFVHVCALIRTQSGGRNNGIPVLRAPGGCGNPILNQEWLAHTERERRMLLPPSGDTGQNSTIVPAGGKKRTKVDLYDKDPRNKHPMLFTYPANKCGFFPPVKPKLKVSIINLMTF